MSLCIYSCNSNTRNLNDHSESPRVATELLLWITAARKNKKQSCYFLVEVYVSSNLCLFLSFSQKMHMYVFS